MHDVARLLVEPRRRVDGRITYRGEAGTEGVTVKSSMNSVKKSIGPSDHRPDKVGNESLLDQIASAVAEGQRDKVFDLAVAFLKDADPEYLLLREVSQRLTISERSVWRLVARGELRAPVHVGSSCRWLSKDVREYQTRIETKRPRTCR